MSDLHIDLSLLLKDEEGEDIYVIEPDVLVGGASNGPQGRKERFWPVKDGLLENEDFVFVTTGSWNKLVSW